MGATAARADPGLHYPAVQQAYIGYVYGDSAVGQAILHELGPTGLPVFNVKTTARRVPQPCSWGRKAVEFGAAEVVLVLGAEQMRPGAPETLYPDRPTSYDRSYQVMQRVPALDEAPIAAQMYGDAGAEYIRRFGADPQTFARIAVEARAHAAGNPNALSTEPVTVQQVLASGPVHGPLTRLQCSPPLRGAAAVLQVVTNPSGGTLAKGHPLGATGVAQCAELVWQLRGQAGARQVDYANLALQHNVGLGGATVVTLYANTGTIQR